jgi:DNA (cytosine-5)-methyltransferase 1
MESKMRILNLYAGVGGNRKLWQGHDITAVESDKDIAEVYQDYFPDDNVIVADAHEYLLEHYKEYDFIWSSPPCTTHSDIRRCGVKDGRYPAKYPDMTLYQEVIFLKHFAEGAFCVENVVPYYYPLIEPDRKLHRHLFWCNFYISPFKTDSDRKHQSISGGKTVYGYNLKNTNINNKRKVLRNLVDPKLGLHILKCAEGKPDYQQKGLFAYGI